MQSEISFQVGSSEQKCNIADIVSLKFDSERAAQDHRVCTFSSKMAEASNCRCELVAAPSVIEPTSILILHRMTSPQWLRHLKGAITALEGISEGQLAALQAGGAALVWAQRSTAKRFTQRPVQDRSAPSIQPSRRWYEDRCTGRYG